MELRMVKIIKDKIKKYLTELVSQFNLDNLDQADIIDNLVKQ